MLHFAHKNQLYLIAQIFWTVQKYKQTFEEEIELIIKVDKIFCHRIMYFVACVYYELRLLSVMRVEMGFQMLSEDISISKIVARYVRKLKISYFVYCKQCQ
ncbi:Hypothetical_protein [Hexamita inflata]|uniref:Hypothetical_protein n=1 Tax=Hexamita inflata TaxID=28002 RepID=A0AA86QG78_9EUKA|nr:Hypothetical protein HINF_LOCUS40209 [Hexamita inflata]